MCLTLRCKQRRHFAAALQEVMEFAVPLTTNEVLQGKSSALGLPMIPAMGWGGTSFLQTHSHPSLHLSLVCQTT